MARPNVLRKLPRKALVRLRANNLWKRLLKYGLALTASVTIAVLPAVIEKYGVSTFLMPLQTIFAQPAQRVGSMIETQILTLSGSVVGTAWGSLGLYLSSFVVDSNVGAAYAIRAMFLLVAIVYHAYVRSSSPKLFAHVFFLVMACTLIVAGNSTHLTAKAVTSIAYPILTAIGINLFFNITVFPEFSSSFLGTSTINILSESVDTLSRATSWFMAPEELEPAMTKPLTKAPTGFSLSQLGSRPTRNKGKYAGLYPKLRSILWNPLRYVGVKKSSKTSAGKEKDESPLVSLTSAKSSLRAGLTRCKAAQREVNFELSLSALPLDVLRPISIEGMAQLVRDIITVIGACENKLLMISSQSEDQYQSTIDEKSRPSTRGTENVDEDQATATGTSLRPPPMPRMKSGIKEEFLEKLKLVKPSHEMEEGDAELLESILDRIRRAVKEFDGAIREAVSFLIACLAYCYDVPKLPSGASAPKGVLPEEIDVRIDSFEEAIASFDRDSMDEFKQLVGQGEEEEVDILPRFETFLISSFLMGFRQAASHILQMLRYVRLLVEARQARKDRVRIYWPHYTSLREWLSLSGEADAMVLPENARKPARTGAEDKNGETSLDAEEMSARLEKVKSSRRDDVETGRRNSEKEKPAVERKRGKEVKSKAQRKAEKSPGWILKLRGKAADTIEWFQASDDVEYTMKLTLAVWLVTWPGFLPSWHDWYAEIRGIWAPLQLILVFEVAIGTSLFVFFIRLFGVVYGCTIGYASFEIGSGNRAVAIIILIIASIPCLYVHLETKYAKAGIVAMTTMTVVALATFNQTGTALNNFQYRLVAFLVGGSVAVLIELALYPVRARDRLIESLSSTIREIGSMQSVLAVGVDSPCNILVGSPALYKRFNSARSRAEAALGAAQTFLPFCLSEPRLKGDFKALVPVYSEIIFVLHQIIDRMDTVVSLRSTYGSSVLEDLNPLVYAYRRNVAGGMALSLFAVNEALTTRFPLPQFLPSNRVAQLRLINRVRELEARQDARSRAASSRPASSRVSRRGSVSDDGSDESSLDEETQIAKRHKVLAWNASTAGQVEIIEYLEELVELAKLIVGVNAFRSGMLRKLDFGGEGRVRLVGTVSAYPSEDEGSDSEERPEVLRRGTGGTGATGDSGSDGGGGRQLRRVATYGFEPVAKEERGLGDFVPASLQRVGTRMGREGGRRRMSILGKGKGVAR